MRGSPAIVVDEGAIHEIRDEANNPVFLAVVVAVQRLQWREQSRSILFMTASRIVISNK